ncbi:MAG: hypothetical protein DRJ01_07420 [Bacteroidetes bacterium]|nr:MAG: hypothetical protein DRJ01_07420 [Bacteroidota bacterium]
MKKEILLILLFFTYFNLTAQYTFEREFTDPLYLINCISDKPIKTDDGGLVMLHHQGNSDDNFNSILIKINNKGEIVKQKEINRDTINIYTVNKTNDNNFVCTGMVKSDTSEYRELAVLKLNSDFEVIEKKQYYQPYGDLGNFNVIRNYKNNFVMAGYFMRVDGQRVYHFPFIFEFTENGDSVRMKYFKNSYAFNDFTILENRDSSGYRLFCDNGLTMDLSWPAINMLDTDFNVDTAYAAPYQTSGEPISPMNITTAKWLSADKYLLSYEINNDASMWDHDLGIAIMDDSTNTLIVDDYTGKPDTTECHAFNAVDFIDKNNIFHVGTSNIIPYTAIPWQKEPSWILLNKYDSTLNLKWQKYYGGDVCYHASSVVATQDGGCLITGVKHDYKQKHTSLSVYLLKVDSLGNYQTTGINKVVEPKNYVLFPNPTTNSFNINLSPASKAKQIELYDIAGKLILSKQLTSSQTKINISCLTKGIYIYRIKNKENIIDTGKLIKQ